MMRITLVTCALLGLACATDVPITVLKCKIKVSTEGWLKVAEISRKLAAESPAEIKAIFKVTHDQMKGSADIIDALPDVATLSNEAQFQLDQNCILAPVGLENLVSVIRAKYPDFAESHAADLQSIENTLAEIRKGMRDCANTA